MNDESDKPLSPVGDDALEARIVAWVLGEASSFEAAELEKRCAEDSALRLFEHRMRVLHGLIAEDVTAGPDAEWKLSEAKRSKITDLLGVDEAAEFVPAAKTNRYFARRILLAAAACLMISVITYSTFETGGIKGQARPEASLSPADRPKNAVPFQESSGVPSKAPDSKYSTLWSNSPMTAKPPATAAKPEARSELQAPQAPAAQAAGGEMRGYEAAGAAGGRGRSQDLAALGAIRRNKDSLADVAPESAGDALGSKPASSATPADAFAGQAMNGVTAPAAVPMEGAAIAGKDVSLRFGRQDSLERGTLSDSQLQEVKESEAFSDLHQMGEIAEKQKAQPQRSLTAGLEFNSQIKPAASPPPADGALSAIEPPLATEPGASFGILTDSIRGGIEKDLTLFPEAAGKDAAADPTIADEARRKLYTAESHYNLSKYGEASRAYEDVLRIDPDNQAARRGMERVAQATTDDYRAAYDHSRAELLAQVDKDWKLPVPPPAGEEKDVAAKPDSSAGDAGAKALLPTKEPAKTPAEISAAAEPFSTFSLHVSDASFKLAKAAIDRGEVPDPAGIRPEEFYNAFDYGDPAPARGEPVACVVEQAAHPAIPQRNLVRIGVRTGAEGRSPSTPLHLTLLLDSSGSMEREDRHAGMTMAVQQLAGLLKEGDTVSAIGFSRQPRLLVDRLPGTRAGELNGLIAQTPSEGGTNLEEGLKLAEELAKRQFHPGAQNRVVLFTDGAANLGDAQPESLQARVEAMRQDGIAFDAAGFGADGLNDKLLERLTRNGNGRYYVVDRPEDAGANFAKQLAGAFRPAAENVKVQVRFNPARVGKYKLIGFEEHRLNKEDFRNDAVDAAEMAAEEAGNALYQVEALPGGEGEIGEVSVRFRDAASGRMVERTWTIPYEEQAAAFDQAKPSLQLAGLAAFAAERLRNAPMADAIDFQQLRPILGKVKARYFNSQAVSDLDAILGTLK